MFWRNIFSPSSEQKKTRLEKWLVYRSEMEETGKRTEVANQSQKQGKGQGPDWPLGTAGPQRGNYYMM
jgi:hypothetical protein